MKKEIFLVQCCYKKEFREEAKKGRKSKMMVYRCNCSPVWATTSKKEAITDCRKYNTNKLNECMYFMVPVNLFE